MERISEFLPQFLTLAFLGSVVFLYVKVVTRHFGDKLKSVSWVEKNQLRVALLVTTPLVCVLCPAIEELVFRALLIVMFNEVSPLALYGILVYAVPFALMHRYGSKITMTEIFLARRNGEYASDVIKEEEKRIYAKKGKKEIMKRKILHVVVTFLFGTLLGYTAIKYQSIWASFWIHAAWNLFVPFIAVSPVFLWFFRCRIFVAVSSRVSRLWYRARVWRMKEALFSNRKLDRNLGDARVAILHSSSCKR